MEFDRLNRWLVLLANVGVIVGIVFLAMEIRVNTAAIRSASIQSITDASGDTLRTLATDEELAALRLTGDLNPSFLNETEAFQYFAYYRQHWLRLQNIYFQWQYDALPEEIWNTYARVVCQDIAKPGIRETWPQHASVLDADFVAFVESCSSDQ